MCVLYNTEYMWFNTLDHYFKIPLRTFRGFMRLGVDARTLVKMLLLFQSFSFASIIILGKMGLTRSRELERGGY
jgi:hypothetical protein